MATFTGFSGGFISTGFTDADFTPNTNLDRRQCNDVHTYSAAHGLGAIPDLFYCIVEIAGPAVALGFTNPTRFNLAGTIGVKPNGPNDGYFQVRADATNVAIDFAGVSGSLSIRDLIMSIAANEKGHQKDFDWTQAGVTLYLIAAKFA